MKEVMIEGGGILVVWSYVIFCSLGYTQYSYELPLPENLETKKKKTYHVSKNEITVKYPVSNLVSYPVMNRGKLEYHLQCSRWLIHS